MTTTKLTLGPTVQKLLDIIASSIDRVEGLDYAIGDAIAMGAHGYRRHTSDVDLFAAEADRNRVLRTLREAGLEVAAVVGPSHYMAYDPDDNDVEARIDVMFPAGDPELSAVELPTRKNVYGHPLNIFPVSVLVLSKFYSDRQKDEMDIAEMYNAGVFDPDEVRRVLAGYDPARLGQYGEMLESFRRKPRRTRPKTRLPRGK